MYLSTLSRRPDEAEMAKAWLKNAPPEAKRWMRVRPIEMRASDARTYWMDGPKEPVSQNWFRCRTPIGDDAHMHQVILAYASDMNLLSTAMRPYGVHWQTPGFQSATSDFFSRTVGSPLPSAEVPHRRYEAGPPTPSHEAQKSGVRAW